MKKGLFCLTFLTVVAIMAGCKKEGSSDSLYEEGFTRVIGVKGTDTSSTKYIAGRVQTVLDEDEDSQLKAELIGYLALPGGQGQYTVRVINKTDCQMILRWQWEGLRLFDGDPDDDVIHGKDTTVYTWIGTAEPGKIYVKSERSNSDCSPSRQLKLEITTIILPINYTNFTRKVNNGQVTVQWYTDSPGDVDTFIVLWTPTGKKEDEVCKYILASNPNRKDYSVTYPANKKLK